MQKSSARTDLALEASLGFGGKTSIKEESIFGCKVSEVNITDKRASELLCKPVGKYLTLDLGGFIERHENSFENSVNALSALLRRFPEIETGSSFLIACLGNEAVTPDAIGPETAKRLIVTRHLKSGLPRDFAGFASVSVLRTGVLGTTGIESAHALRAVAGLVRPDCIIAVDALASAELDRLCRCIQLSDSGIAPGSGVGNDREALSRDSLGVPVIAVGVPTVIDAQTISDDAAAEGLFVTPRNIDELVSSVSKLIAYGINIGLHKGLSVQDVDLLIC